MKQLAGVLISWIIFILISVGYFPTTLVFAGNPPDAGHSSLNPVAGSSSQVPADGHSAAAMIVVLKDSSGNNLSGDSVTFQAPNDSAVSFSPSSATLNASGSATFNITSTNVGTDSINIIDNTTNTTLTGLGSVTFTAVSPASNCADAAPGNAPQLKSAVAESTKSITLTWTKANDPVSYYLLVFGLSSGNYIYGAPNIGSRDATSFVVKSLTPGTKYFFAVKAVNGCMPGALSNELSASTLGLTKTVTASPPVPSTTLTPAPTPSAFVSNSPDTSQLSPTPTPTPELTQKNSLAGVLSNKLIIGDAVVILLLIGVLFVYLQIQKRRGRLP